MSCTRRALLALTVTRNRLFFWKRGIGRNLFRRRRPEASRMLEIDRPSSAISHHTHTLLLSFQIFDAISSNCHSHIAPLIRRAETLSIGGNPAANFAPQ